MFYVNNKQVLGLFLNGNSCNYITYHSGKIIPENRNAQFTYINLAGRKLSHYRVEYGNIQSGYDNFPVPRLDYPVNGIFNSPYTYYYGGDIVPTKNVPVYISNGYCAIRGPVYNDININGNIVHFASNTDFQGHNVSIHPERGSSTVPYFNGTVMDNCSNFSLRAGSRLSKSSQVTLYGCKNFSGQFNYFGDANTRFPGFRGFLTTCRDGSFNFNLINMHGGGSDANVTNYYNFSCISNSNNIKLNINGSPWQAWVHPNCYSNNCTINTRHIVSGFSYMNDCNFNVVLPKDSNPEMNRGFEFLNNANNCNYNLYATDVNLSNYRAGVGHSAFFDSLNNCNLNLLVNNTVSFDHSFGGNFSHCNIIFDNIKANLSIQFGWKYLYNCNITGNVEASSTSQGFLEYCDGINVNLNAAKSSRILPMYGCNNVRGNLVAGDITYVSYSNYLNLNVSNGTLNLINVEHSRFNSNGTNICGINLNNCKFEIYNSNAFEAYGVSNSNFNMRNSAGTAILSNLNNVDFVERTVGAGYTITGINYCNNSWIYANTLSGLLENVYNTSVKLKNNNPNFQTRRVDNCEITGFPTTVAYTANCTFNASLSVVAFRNSRYLTWANVWPHATYRGSDGWNALYRTKAGLRSVDNFSSCYLACDNGSLLSYSGMENFNNINNMQTDIKTFYNGTVTANLPIYNMNIKLNVDCNTLNLGVFQAGPPHGFQNATISANTIYAKGTEPGAYVQVTTDTKIYCENYCNVCFRPSVFNYNSVLQPVILINNYDHANSGKQYFYGGLVRIGRQSTRTGQSSFVLYNGTCMFINNAVLNGVIVNNSLLFLGSNVTFTNAVNVTNGGLVVNKENWGSHAREIRSRVGRGHLAWNIWDSGPWGPQTLFDYCTNV